MKTQTETNDLTRLEELADRVARQFLVRIEPPDRPMHEWTAEQVERYQRMKAVFLQAMRNGTSTLVSLLILVLIVSMTVHAAASTIVLPVDPGIVNQPPSSGRFDFPFTDLNGVVLNGDLLSDDFIFANNILARARVLTPSDLNVDLLLQTNGVVHGLPGSQPTGFLLAPDGTPMQAPIFAGQALSDDGRYAVGLNFLPGTLSPQTFDAEGWHLNVFLPGLGGPMITGAEIAWTATAPSTLQFGTEAQLPEPLTVVLLGLALGVSLMVSRQMGTP